MRTLSTVFFTLIAVAVIGIASGFGFIYSGYYDVSASTPDNAYLAWAIHKTSDTSVDAREAANTVPADIGSPEMIAAGGKLFVQNCAVCHGAPGVAPTHIAMGLNPTPPDLYRADRHPDPQENFQFIHNGVKMTAMPAFGASEGDAHVWQLVAFLNKLPGISKADFATLTGGAAPVAN